MWSNGIVEGTFFFLELMPNLRVTGLHWYIIYIVYIMAKKRKTPALEKQQGKQQNMFSFKMYVFLYNGPGLAILTATRCFRPA